MLNRSICLAAALVVPVLTAQTAVTTNYSGPNTIPVLSNSTLNASSLAEFYPGKVTVRDAFPWAAMNVQAPALGTNVGDRTFILSLANHNGNGNALHFFQVRGPGDPNWYSSSTRIQNYTDGSAGPYIEFNPPGGADALAFGAGDTEVLRLLDGGIVRLPDGGVMQLLGGGKLGIGTASSYASLTIGSSAGDGSGSWRNGLLFTDTSAPGMEWSHAAIYTQGSTNYNGSLIFATDGDNARDFQLSEKMRVGFDGKVGIGTSNPNSLLEVNGNVALTPGSGAGVIFQDGSVLRSAAALANLTQANNQLTFSGNTFSIGPAGSSVYGDGTNIVLNAPQNGNVYLAPIGIDGTRVSSDGSLRVGGPGQTNAMLYGPAGRPSVSLGLGRFLPYVSNDLQIDANPGPNGVTGLWIGSGTSFERARSFSLIVKPDNAADRPGFTIFDGGVRSSGFQFAPNTAGAVIDFTMGPPGNYSTALHLADNGNVGIGNTAPQAKLDVGGTIKISGQGGGIIFNGPDLTPQTQPWTGTVPGGDYAESVDVTGDKQQYEAGDLLMIDADHPGQFLKVTSAYSSLVAGVYATKPGVIGRRQPFSKDKSTEVPMALVGIVPTKVSAENGPIRPGDLLVASSTPGYAMRGTDRERLLGAVIGKALAAAKGDKDLIEVLITLQ